MESFLSDYLTIFQNLTLPGFFYLFGILLLVQAFTKIKIFEKIKDDKEHVFFIGILVIVLSFIIGFVFYLSEQEVKSIFIKSLDDVHPKCTVDSKGYSNVYGVLIMLRHLIISIFFIIISLTVYYKKENKTLNNKGFFILFYTSLVLILSLSYFKIKYLIDSWSTNKPIGWFWILITIVILWAISLMAVLGVKTSLKK
jgi:hypothetical protein